MSPSSVSEDREAQSTPRRRSRRRRGTVLVAALGLLVLAAALLAGSVAASAALRRGTRSLVAAARAESETRRALGEMVIQWDADADSLPVGGSMERPLSAPLASAEPAVVHARLQRLTSGVFVASVTVQVGADASVMAYRRAQLLLVRTARGDSLPSPPLPIARWSVIDLH